MKDYIRPALLVNLDHVAIHFDTNDLNTDTEAERK